MEAEGESGGGSRHRPSVTFTGSARVLETLVRFSRDSPEIIETVIDLNPIRCTLWAVVGGGLKVGPIVESEGVDAGQSEFIDLSPDSASTVRAKSSCIDAP